MLRKIFILTSLFLLNSWIADGAIPRSNKYCIYIKYNSKIVDSVPVYFSYTKDGDFREWGGQINKGFHFANVELKENVKYSLEIKVKTQAKSVIIRPTRSNIKGNLRSLGEFSVMQFPLNHIGKFSIEFDDDSLNQNPLIIFVNPIQTSKLIPVNKDNILFSDRTGSNIRNITSNKTTVFFKPGTYDIGLWLIPKSIRQIYLQDGAVVNGYFRAERSSKDKSLTINGRGIISNDIYPFHYPSKNSIHTYEHNSNWYKPLEIIGGKGHLIEGITVVCSTGPIVSLTADSSKIDNIKLNGFRLTNDGITLSGNNLQITNCFVRCNDDAIVLGVVNGVDVVNCIFWQLQAGSVVQLGWTPHNIKNVIIKNCDVLHTEWKDVGLNAGFLNMMAVRRNPQRSTIGNISLTNIFFDTSLIRFIDIGPDKTAKNFPGVGLSEPWVLQNLNVSNIFFKRLSNNKAPLIFIHGYSDQIKATGVNFDNMWSDRTSLRTVNPKILFDIKNVEAVSYEDVKL